MEFWANHLAGAAPGGCEVHHHQLVSGLLQFSLEILLQKRNTDFKLDQTIMDSCLTILNILVDIWKLMLLIFTLFYFVVAVSSHGHTLFLLSL